mmetsp:Transcript_4090/g.9266  ORF Transcript_4090/g.9266 Transcript_4090/m.9266 type:complete len:83 (-) Transcript_4090:31-279(-)
MTGIWKVNSHSTSLCQNIIVSAPCLTPTPHSGGTQRGGVGEIDTFNETTHRMQSSQIYDSIPTPTKKYFALRTVSLGISFGY